MGGFLRQLPMKTFLKILKLQEFWNQKNGKYFNKKIQKKQKKWLKVYWQRALIRYLGIEIYGCGSYSSDADEVRIVDKISPSSTSYWFCGVSKIIGIENLNTSNVIKMDHMFSGSNFTNLDLSSFDTSNVTDMEHMFANCSSLQIWI